MRRLFIGEYNIEGVMGHRDDLGLRFFCDRKGSNEIGVIQTSQFL